MTVQCCKCSSVRTDGLWHEPVPKVDEPVSHTYCPCCYETALEEMRRELALYAERTPAIVPIS